MDDQTPPPPPPRTDEPASPPPPTDSTITTEDHYSDRISDMELVVLEPKVGTIFNYENEAHDYYASYAKAKGFGAVTKTSKKREDGIKSNITYGCHRSGKPRKRALNPVIFAPTTKIDCKSHVNISLQVDGKWRLNLVELNHNHEMDPDKARYLKCYRTVPPHARRTIELSAASGIRLNKTIASCVIEAGGPENLTWSENDARNYKDKVRRLQLKEGDAQAMYNYFVKMQKDNGDFFYAIDADEDNRLRNVFWGDARSRESYKEFGDVVTFDTTYLVNTYDMSFTPFVGGQPSWTVDFVWMRFDITGGHGFISMVVRDLAFLHV